MTENPGFGLAARFMRGLALAADHPAIRFGTQTSGYQETYERALTWAGALLALPAAPPKAIGILADKGVTAYEGILAALFTGATVVPLHPDFPVARTRYMLETSGASAVLADEHGSAVLNDTELGLPVLTPQAPHRGYPAIDAPRHVRADDVAYHLFTSGSTGRPKGVPITHGNLDHHFRLMDQRYPFNAADVFAQVLDLNFDCAIFEMFSAWGAGATMCHIPATAYRELPAFAAKQGLTVWFSTPSAISLIRRMSGLTAASLPTLRWSFFAGEALRCHDAADWQAAAPGSAVENLYGPTELTLTITGHRWSPEDSPRLAVNGIVPIGAVYPGHDHFLRTPDGGVSPVEGELCITGPQLSPGYLNPEDDLERFVTHHGRRWYRTGDRIRRLPNGELAYLGRMDSQVQIRGLRVELAEIDHAMRACPGVTDAVTVARPSGDSLELMVFYTGELAAPVALVGRLRQILPAAMVPRVFQHVAEFPLNSNKKIDKLRLADMAATPR